MNNNFDNQFNQMEIDIAWDKYLDDCRILGIPTMPYGIWKLEYLKGSC